MCLMEQIAVMDVLLVGLRGVGVEIAKCLALSGIHRLTLLDDDFVRREDYGVNFLLQEGDLGKHKAKQVAARLNALGPFADVRTIPGALTLDLLLNYHLVVFSSYNYSWEELIAYNEFCRAQTPPIGFVLAESRGVVGYVFTDFGPLFISDDAEQVEEVTILAKRTQPTSANSCKIILQEQLGICLLESGDRVMLRCTSKSSINTECIIKSVVSPTHIEVTVLAADITESNLLDEWHESVQMADRLSKQSQRRTISHKSLRENTVHPGLIQLPTMSDFEPNRPETLHAAMQGIYSFRRQYGFLPENGNAIHQEQVIQLAHNIVVKRNILFQDQGRENETEWQVDDITLEKLTRCPSTEFHAVSALVGGFASIQSMKYCGKMGEIVHPESQFLYFDGSDIFQALRNCNKSGASSTSFGIEAFCGSSVACALFCSICWNGFLQYGASEGAQAFAINFDHHDAVLNPTPEWVGKASRYHINLREEESTYTVSDSCSQVLLSTKYLGNQKAVAVRELKQTMYMNPDIDVSTLRTPGAELQVTRIRMSALTKMFQEAIEFDRICRIHEKPFLFLHHGNDIELNSFVPNVTNTFAETFIPHQKLQSNGIYPFDHLPPRPTAPKLSVSITEQMVQDGVVLFDAIFKTALGETKSLIKNLGGSGFADDNVWRAWFMVRRSRITTYDECVQEAWKLMEALEEVSSTPLRGTIFTSVDISNADHLQILAATSCIVAKTANIAIPEEVELRREAITRAQTNLHEFSLFQHPRNSSSILAGFRAADPAKLLRALENVHCIDFDEQPLHYQWLQAYANIRLEALGAPRIDDLAAVRRLRRSRGEYLPIATILGALGLMQILKIVQHPIEPPQLPASNKGGELWVSEYLPLQPVSATSLALEATRGTALRVTPEGFTRWTKVILPRAKELQTIQAMISYVEAKFNVKIHAILHDGREIVDARSKSILSK
ncbi:TPA: LOW QUALITY PROTEIN: hypothetical protein N0F65_005517, partial [Lagenidium giganteum]